MTDTSSPSSPVQRRYVPAVGPRLKKLLAVVFGLFALLTVNSVYLSSISLAEAATGQVYQNWFYLIMFLVHLVLGTLIILPVVVFGIAHLRNARHRKNRRAVRVGYALFTVALLLLASGVVLTRLEGIIEVRDPAVRSIAYWVHVVAPIAAIWLFVLHRLAGRRIKWRVGLAWAGVAGVFALIMLGVQSQDPRRWNVEGNPQGEAYFFPSLARTLDGNFISADVLQYDDYCRECHADIHASWSESVHRFSSFNNPPYLFSVRQTREFSMERDGTVVRSRFCAGCHDPVPFFSGAFNDPNFDDVNDPTAHAGITCSVCHSITHVNSVRGNADYTIAAPIHYPFATSQRPALRWVNRQLVKSKPGFHRKTFLKPLHKTTEFCGTCHKVHLPQELNDYKWLRGQNHYDAFLLSGVSGHGITSFYYPKKAEANCNGCHLPLVASADFGARARDDSGELKVHDHQFPSANTAMPLLAGMERPQEVIAKHQRFLEGVMRVDLFGVKPGGRIDAELIAPLRPEVPALRPGTSYLLEVVIRTLKLGHLFTQGTADSNEVWLEVEATSGGRVVGRSGGRGPAGEVDPWSHFVNAFVLDRDGYRIDRRNAQDIFIPLYNNQIPPGAGDTVHYRFEVGRDVTEPLTIEVRLQYRKFDTTYMKHVYGADYVNELPVTTLATDRVTFPVEGVATEVQNGPSPIEPWQRWNDYGIGLLRKGGAGELVQAEHAFWQVERLGQPDGPLNRARVYIEEGRVAEEAPEALRVARDFDPPAAAWSLLWFTGLVHKQNGRFDEAIASFEQILEGGFAQAQGRNFDFTRDYRLLNELGQTLYERAKQERGEDRRAERERLLSRAVELFEKALEQDPENLTAHYNLSLLHADLGDRERASEHAARHAVYKPDDNAGDRAIAAARRRYPAANHAAEAVVIYDLQRTGAYDLPADGERMARHAP
jgi:tetratricopeptide (TPR) repeat protein